MAGTKLVARGCACGARMRSHSRSSLNALMNGATKLSMSVSAFPASEMIRSSTSVRFMIWNTSYPLTSSQRRSRSSKRKVRKFPMCA